MPPIPSRRLIAQVIQPLYFVSSHSLHFFLPLVASESRVKKSVTRPHSTKPYILKMRSIAASSSSTSSLLGCHHISRLVHIISASILFTVLLANSVHGFAFKSKTRCNHMPSSAMLVCDGPKFECVLTQQTHTATSTSLNAKKKQIKGGASVEEEDDDSSNSGIMGIFKKSPGTIIIAPFILLFGLDLIANIAVVTKRSLEVLFTGEYTVWTPWQ